MISNNMNLLPKHVLESLKTCGAILFCSEDTKGLVYVTPHMKPHDLQIIQDEYAKMLEEIRRREVIYSITLVLLKLDSLLISQAVEGLNPQTQVLDELENLLKLKQELYVAYVITHFNHKPLNELTVFVGGDCYRKDRNTLLAVLERTSDLARAMIRKSVLIFPDIPTLHAGKKGEWIIIDKKGEKIEAISDEAIIALGTLIIPLGINFINQYKEQQLTDRGIVKAFPSINFIRPDSASPDVLSGTFWKQMCEAWYKRNWNLNYITCLPDSLGGPSFPSSRPTGYGLATTVIELIKAYFGEDKINTSRFLLEALGGVGLNTLEALINQFHIPPENITAFDPNPLACKNAQDKYGLPNVHPMSHHEFYTLFIGEQNTYDFDVWINNGLGDNTKYEYVQALLAGGVRLFCGAANNILEVKSRPLSLEAIFNCGGWVWPDEAASGGGWTLAIVDLYRRCKGFKGSDQEIEKHVISIITSRNASLVKNVMERIESKNRDGKNIWEQVNLLIDERVERSIHLSIPDTDLLQFADVSSWKL